MAEALALFFLFWIGVGSYIAFLSQHYKIAGPGFGRFCIITWVWPLIVWEVFAP